MTENTQINLNKWEKILQKEEVDNSKVKLLVAGMGGGLDVMNAAAVYYQALESGIDVTLGSIKSRSIDNIVNGTPIHENAAWILPESRFSAQADGVRGRYCEAAIASAIKKPVLYFSQRMVGSEKTNKASLLSLRDAIISTKDKYGFTHMLFVDCGGDSLILKKGDAMKYSESTDPFAGNDANSQFALEAIPDTYMGVAGIGLDIDKKRAYGNLRMIARDGAYCGCVDLQTGEKTNWNLPFEFSSKNSYNDMYGALARKIVKLTPQDANNSTKFSSLTAPVLYHSIRGEYGPQFTAANWAQGEDGNTVDVEKDHALLHIVKASRMQSLKEYLNRRCGDEYRKKLLAVSVDQC